MYKIVITKHGHHSPKATIELYNWKQVMDYCYDNQTDNITIITDANNDHAVMDYSMGETKDNVEYYRDQYAFVIAFLNAISDNEKIVLYRDDEEVIEKSWQF